MNFCSKISCMVAWFNSNKEWRQLCKLRYLFQNYFGLLTIGTIVLLLTGMGYIISILFPCVIYYLALTTRKKESPNFLDLLWWIFFFMNIQSWLLNSYPFKVQLIGRFIMAQGAYMIAYWIGRYSTNNNLERIFSNAIVPLVLTSLFGIYCYLFRPSWYMSMLYAQYLDVGQQSFQEFARLRSIFPSPYTLAYFCSMMMAWLWFKLFCEKKATLHLYMLICILLVTLILCMMRAPWACTCFSFCLSLFYAMKYAPKSNLFKRLLPLGILGILITSYVSIKIDTEDLLFLTEKFSTVSSNQKELVSQRASLYDIKQSWLGEGAGRHASYADEYPPNYQLPDGEYQKLQVEVGNIGMFCLCILFGLGGLKAIRHLKYLYLELCIVLMCMITMLGASSLTMPNEHPFIFWLALGQISRFNIKKNNGKSKNLCNVPSSVSLYSRK